MQMKNVLLVSYHFPPEISGGVGRPYSLYKYLPRYGCRPIVITTSCYGQTSEEKNIHRFDALANWPNSGSTAKKFILKTGLHIARRAGFVELKDVYWQNNVMNKIDKLFMAQQIQVVYATFPAIDSLRIGLSLTMRYNIPLIAEFRDGLAYEPLIVLPRLNKSRLKTFESRVIKASSSVITIGENLSHYFSVHYSGIPIHTVHNGFDPADFQHLSGVTPAQAFKKTIFYFGSFNLSRRTNVIPLFKALQRLKKETLLSCSNCELCLVGRYTRHEQYLIKYYHLEDIVRIYPIIEKSAGFSWMTKDASYLLFYGVDGQKTIISSKLLEYLNLGKPIIGICRGNEAEKIIIKTKTGEVCDFHEDSIYILLKKCLTDGIMYEPQKAEINKFNRVYQTKKISEIITDIVTRNGERQ